MPDAIQAQFVCSLDITSLNSSNSAFSYKMSYNRESRSNSYNKYLNKFKVRDAPSPTPGVYQTMKLPEEQRTRLERFMQRHKGSSYSQNFQIKPHSNQNEQAVSELKTSISELDTKLEQIKGRQNTSQPQGGRPRIKTLPVRSAQEEIRDMLSQIDSKLSSLGNSQSIQEARRELEELQYMSVSIDQRRRTVEQHKLTAKSSQREQLNEIEQQIDFSEQKLREQANIAYGRVRDFVQKSPNRSESSVSTQNFNMEEFYTPDFSPETKKQMHMESRLKQQAYELEERTLGLIKAEKQLKSQQLSLSSMKNDIKQQEIDLKRKNEALQQKERDIKNGLDHFKVRANLLHKEFTYKLSRSIVDEIVMLAILQSQERQDVQLTSRKAACRLATEKMNKSLIKIETLNRQIEQQALHVIELKGSLSQRETQLELASDQLSRESKLANKGKSESLLRRRQEILKKREQTFNEKLSKLNLMQKNLEGKEKELDEKERQMQRVSQNPLPNNERIKKLEEAIKEKENYLQSFEEQLETEEQQVNQQLQAAQTSKTEIMAKIQQLQQNEKKNESYRMQIKKEYEAFLIYKQTEEERLQEWQERIDRQVEKLNEIESLKDQINLSNDTLSEESDQADAENYESIDFAKFSENFHKKQSSQSDPLSGRRQLSQQLSELLTDIKGFE